MAFIGSGYDYESECEMADSEMRAHARGDSGVRGPASNHVHNTLQRAEIRYWKGLDITRTTGDGA